MSTLAKRPTSFTSYGKYNTFCAGNIKDTSRFDQVRHKKVRNGQARQGVQLMVTLDKHDFLSIRRLRIVAGNQQRA